MGSNESHYLSKTLTKKSDKAKNCTESLLLKNVSSSTQKNVSKSLFFKQKILISEIQTCVYFLKYCIFCNRNLWLFR